VASRRKQILAALKSAIDNISTANGYNYDIGLNSLKYHDLTQVPPDKFPAITYLPGPSSYFPLTNEDYTSGGSYAGIDGWQIGVIGYLQVDSDVSQGANVINAMEDLVEDIVRAVMADEQLGLSFVENCYLSAIVPSLDFLDQNIAIVQVIFSVKYDFPKGIP